MDKRIRFSLLYGLFAIILVWIVQSILIQRVTEIPYSQFKEMLRSGQVREVIIGEGRVQGLTKDGKVFNTVALSDPDLLRELEAQKVKYKGEYQNPWLRELFFGWILPLGILAAIWGVAMKRMRMGGDVMTFGRSRAKLYAEKGVKVTFEDVAGVEEAKEELQEIIEFLKNPEKFQRLGGRIPKGVLLVGPPGTGKTLLARAVAGEAGVPFFAMSGSEFVEMFVGVGAARVRDLFQQAQAKAPCIVFIDEIDAIGRARGGITVVGGHDEREQTLNQLLAEMDGFDSRKGVIIMAATNRPNVLDPALIRPGRFDRQIVVDRPDLKGREAILRVHARNIPLAEDVDLKVIAARTPGFVGADLANVMNEAALLAARRGKEKVTMGELEEAIERVIAGLEKKSRVMNPREKERVAYHEAGHAIVASLLPGADPVHKVSIIPRGMALGTTFQLPTEDRYLLTRNELLDRLAVLLGGRAAEELVFGEISTGAKDDLEKVSEIARRMVTEYGMSKTLGPLSFERPDHSFLGNTIGFTGEKAYSEQTAQAIDQEVKRIVEERYEMAKELLRNHRERLEQLAKILLEKEVIEGEELKRILP